MGLDKSMASSYKTPSSRRYTRRCSLHRFSFGVRLEHELANGGDGAVVVVQARPGADRADCARVVFGKESRAGCDEGEV